MTIRTGFVLIFTLLGLSFLFFVREVVIIGFLAILLATVMSFPIQILSKVMPRGLAVVLTLILGGALFGGIGVAAYKPLSDQVVQLVNHVPQAVERVQSWFARTQQAPSVTQFTQGQSFGATVQEKLKDAAEAILSKAGPVALSFSTLLSGLIIIIVLAAFFIHEPKSYLGVIRSFFPREDDKIVDELWDRLGHVLRHWMGGILVSMTIMGGVAGIGLLIVGIQDWAILGFLTFIGTFVPYVGAIASAVPGLMIALSQSTEHFIGALFVYLAVHLIEGYIVEPMVMKRAVVIHPGSLLIWQLAMAALFGILGIMIATPLLACFKVTVGYLYVERKLNKELKAI